jgi:UDP-3-O-[3-hydroxymyristoyl] glucosamine N-acyltransferase
MEFTTGQIAGLIGGEIEGDPEISVSTIASIEDAKAGSISFLSNPKYESYVYSTQASAVIVNQNFEAKKTIDTTLIRVKDAYLAFTALLKEYQRLMAFQRQGVEPMSYIGEGSTYGDDVYIGAFAYIGKHVKMGRNTKIHPQVYIGDNVEIGDHTIIYPGVKIYSQCKIGSYCTLQAGAVIGSDGFGFAPKEDGSYENIPQIGNVILEDHVDIGANTTVDCATFNSTIIRKGVKIDNLVQVAHNVEIGDNTVIASQSGISGSTKIGKQVVMAGQVGIVGHIKIADHTSVGAQSGVAKSTRKGDVLFGSPAIDKHQQARALIVYKKLPELMKRVEALEEKILNLPT